MPVYTVKNQQNIILHKCLYCSMSFDEKPNSQLVQVLHVMMCPQNDKRQEKEKRRVKRLNEKKTRKLLIFLTCIRFLFKTIICKYITYF
jgi:hypothetical protein